MVGQWYVASFEDDSTSLVGRYFLEGVAVVWFEGGQVGEGLLVSFVVGHERHCDMVVDLTFYVYSMYCCMMYV